MTFDEIANNIVSETQLIDNTAADAKRVKAELVKLIVSALQDERNRCIEWVQGFANIQDRSSEMIEAIRSGK
jgi:hypothetical protein